MIRPVSWLCLFLLFFITGCAVISSKVRLENAEKISRESGWSRRTFNAGMFDITGFSPSAPLQNRKVLTIYIEGDGLAWISRSRISQDPTPLNPIGLKLALQHPNGSVLYLARPFQFGQKRNLNNRYWTSARFSKEVIFAYTQILDQLKIQYDLPGFCLVGYSGGGAIATLLAAKRQDVELLITVAGNLDHRMWTAIHNVSPLTDSLNPADFFENLVRVPQVHFYGSKDTIVPGEVVLAFARKFPESSHPITIAVQDTAHGSVWADKWPDLLKSAELRLQPENVLFR